MQRPKRTKRDGLTAEARRLLDALAHDDASAVRDGTSGALVLRAPGRTGIFLSRGRFSSGAASVLVQTGLAAWEESGARPRLVATAAGRARLRREAAEPDVAFLAQHRALERSVTDTEHGSAAVWRDTEESPLAWLARRRDASGRPLIGVAALAAGDRLRRDLTLARTLPSVTANWTAIVIDRGRAGRGGPEPMLDMVLSARARVDAALTAAGPAMAGLLLDVCGFLKGLEEIEHERGWPARSAKVVLGVALERLASHYGLAEEARGHDSSRGLRVWAEDGWRPSIA
jgi:hypothetical protein